RPWTFLKEQHPHGEQRGVEPHEAHGSRECGNPVRYAKLNALVPLDRLLDDGRVVGLAALEKPTRNQPAQIFAPGNHRANQVVAAPACCPSSAAAPWLTFRTRNADAIWPT